MAHTKSAKKRLRQDEKRRRRNQARKSRLRSASKSVLKAARGSNLTAAEAALKEAVSAIDRAAQRNVIHKNAAARRKSRLSKAVEALRKAGSTKASD